MIFSFHLEFELYISIIDFFVIEKGALMKSITATLMIVFKKKITLLLLFLHTSLKEPPLLFAYIIYILKTFMVYQQPLLVLPVRSKTVL